MIAAVAIASLAVWGVLLTFWCASLDAAVQELERERVELAVRVQTLLTEETASESRATPGIGTPPLIPPPFDAESAPTGCSAC